MGMFDTVMVPCPKCGERYAAQSKSGECDLSTYHLETCPSDALGDVNRHAPFVCEGCGAVFEVQFHATPRIVPH